MIVRPHRWVLLVSFIIGIAGSSAYVISIIDYRETAEAYTSIRIAAIPATFAWADETQQQATVLLEIDNSSRTDLMIEHLELRLYAGGAFVGAMYEQWQPLAVDARSVEQVTVTIEVSTPGGKLPEEGGLRLSGDAHLAFEGIDQPFVVRFSDELEGVSGG